MRVTASRWSALRWTTLALLGTVAVAPSWVWACPSCKDALAGDPVGAALSWTTLVLIGVPLVLMGSIGGWVSYVYWRAARGGWEAPDATRQPTGVLGP